MAKNKFPIINADSDDENETSEEFDDDKKKFTDTSEENEEDEENEDNIDEDLEDDLEDEDSESNSESDEENDNCLYDYANIDDDDVQDNIVINNNDKITKPYISKFERVRMISDRTSQLARGAKSMLKNVKGMNPEDVALLELKNKVIPLIVERKLPDGSVEKWKVSEFKNL